MATNTTIKVTRGGRVISKIMKAMSMSAIGGNSGIAHMKRRAWVCSGAPTVDSGATTAASFPVTKGELLYDTTNASGYTCTVSPSASTAGTFVKLHA